MGWSSLFWYCDGYTKVIIGINPTATRLAIDYWSLADSFPAIADAERKKNPSRKTKGIGKSESWPNADAIRSAQAFQSAAWCSFYEFRPEYESSSGAINVF